MTNQYIRVFGLIFSLTILSACSNPHFFPLVRPLFIGFDETMVPENAKAALAMAKVDFMCARHGGAPQFAKYFNTTNHKNSRVYYGDGYTLTIEDRSSFSWFGPHIVLDTSITGGDPFRYAELSHETD